MMTDGRLSSNESGDIMQHRASQSTCEEQSTV